MNEHSRISAGVGDSLALEFANTAGWHLRAEPAERLEKWPDVVRWANEQHLLSSDQIARLARAQIAIEPVLALRETIFRVGFAAATGAAPDNNDLASVAAQAATSPPASMWANGRLFWRFQETRIVEELLGLIARDAILFFASDRVGKLRVCAGPDCGWLFIDESRGKPRRWCSMSDCGNRAKARRSHSRRER